MELVLLQPYGAYIMAGDEKRLALTTACRGVTGEVDKISPGNPEICVDQYPDHVHRTANR